eukprot:CAMPEP_0201886784 /NCGR_PEP_ID=MMETSP0902-20130614/23167_1 /ASSEMBLY_ACC=CAM_ASM_000551 /TAXON_ID=420261 /ORGANISM="Thalassiosira antarctica, Strain CCMP982" /LENGTH=180 /DNA_ID=CAMNT_0048416495 /DNA_START=131 /DNA_END=673 /DNA_ORIENTATION=+
MSIASGLPIRRSVAKFTADPLPDGAVSAAVEAASMAPNHFLSAPTRMYNLGPETVNKLKALNEDKAKMFDTVPNWMLVTIKTEHLDESGGISAKLALEDHAAVSCAIQNFMQSLAEDGVGSKWMTGALGLDPNDIVKAANVPEGELMVGMIWYGVPATPLAEAKAPKRKLGVDELLIELP